MSPMIYWLKLCISSQKSKSQMNGMEWVRVTVLCDRRPNNSQHVVIRGYKYSVPDGNPFAFVCSLSSNCSLINWPWHGFSLSLLMLVINCCLCIAQFCVKKCELSRYIFKMLASLLWLETHCWRLWRLHNIRCCLHHHQDLSLSDLSLYMVFCHTSQVYLQ